MTQDEIKQKLNDAGLHVIAVNKYNLQPGDAFIDLKGPLTYRQLAQVSEALGTDAIDIDSDADNGSYVPESWVALVVYGVLDTP